MLVTLTALALTAVTVVPGTASAAEPAEGTLITTPLTGKARADAVAQERVTDVAESVRALDPAGERLSTVRVDPATGTVDVWWAGTAPARLTALGDAVRVHTAAFSAKTLETSAETFLKAWRSRYPNGLDGYTVTRVGPDAAGSGLTIGVSHVDPAKKAAPAPPPATVIRAVDTLADGVPATSVTAVPRAEAAVGDRHPDAPPWWGGGRIVNATTRDRCSSGYLVRTSSNALRTLSASHCTWDGRGDFGAGGRIWATQANIQVAALGSHTDSLMANTSGSDSARIYTGGWHSNVQRLVSGQSATFQDHQVCTSGATSGAHCGLIVRSITLTTVCIPSGACADVRGWWAENPNVGVAVAGGDSGGPVYVPRADGTVTIRGIISAGAQPITCPPDLAPDVPHSCSHWVFFVDVPDLNAYWGVTTATG